MTIAQKHYERETNRSCFVEKETEWFLDSSEEPVRGVNIDDLDSENLDESKSDNKILKIYSKEYVEWLEEKY